MTGTNTYVSSITGNTGYFTTIASMTGGNGFFTTLTGTTFYSTLLNISGLSAGTGYFSGVITGASKAYLSGGISGAGSYFDQIAVGGLAKRKFSWYSKYNLDFFQWK